MEDEVFEKYFERITDAYFDYIGSVRRRKLKEILEEIYNKGYSDGFGYLIDGKEAKP